MSPALKTLKRLAVPSLHSSGPWRWRKCESTRSTKAVVEVWASTLPRHTCAYPLKPSSLVHTVMCDSGPSWGSGGPLTTVGGVWAVLGPLTTVGGVWAVCCSCMITCLDLLVVRDKGCCYVAESDDSMQLDRTGHGTGHHPRFLLVMGQTYRQQVCVAPREKGGGPRGSGSHSIPNNRKEDAC